MKKNLILGDNGTHVDSSAFYDKGLKNLTLSYKIRSFGEFAFRGNKLKSIIIPHATLYIGWGAFAENEITNLILGNNVAHISDYAFYDNKLTSLKIPESILYIGENAFDENTSLKRVYVYEDSSYLYKKGGKFENVFSADVEIIEY